MAADPRDVEAAALEVVRKLRGKGHQALWAGGSVRDRLLGRSANDIDVATSATPDQVQELFPRSHADGKQFLVVRVRERVRKDCVVDVEVATFRVDERYVDGRRPESVRISTMEEDAQRRDFTINGMFLDPIHDEVLDFVGGREDLVRGVVRAIGDPERRFLEDRLRILRAPRFAARLGFRIDPATLEAGRAHAAEVPRDISAERILDELNKILAGPTRARGLLLCEEIGILEHVLPEARLDLPRALRALEALAPDGDAPLEVAWAAALHLAPPAAVDAALVRLRSSNQLRDRARNIVEALPLARALSERGVADQKRFLRRPEVADGDVAAVLRAASLAGDGDLEPGRFLRARWRAFTADPTPAAPSAPPLVKGGDLQAAGLAPGKHFSRLLAAVEDAQLEGRVRTKAEGVALALTLHASPSG